MAKEKISMVIPVYNESKRIATTLKKMHEYVNTCNYDIEIIIVNDGSTDHTVNLVKKLSKDFPEVFLLDNKINQGKGGAVRDGMLFAQGDYVLFTDADLSTPISELDKLLAVVKKGCDIAIGSRRMNKSNILVPQPFHRRLMGFVFQKIVSFFFLNGFKDTQCGFKLFTAEAGRKIFGQLQLNGFAFDIEALYLANLLNYKIAEVPVIWNNAKGSKVEPITTALKMIRELFYIRIFYFFYYSKSC